MTHMRPRSDTPHCDGDTIAHALVHATVIQPARAGLSITAGTSDLLVVPFYGFRHAPVHDSAYIRLVDAHSEREGGHNNGRVPFGPRGLHSIAFGGLQATVVAAGLDTSFVELASDLERCLPLVR